MIKAFIFMEAEEFPFVNGGSIVSLHFWKIWESVRPVFNLIESILTAIMSHRIASGLLQLKTLEIVGMREKL